MSRIAASLPLVELRVTVLGFGMRVEPVREVTGIVENGLVKLPETVRLPDGARVRVILEEPTVPFEKEPLDDAEVEADLAWADGKRFSS